MDNVVSMKREGQDYYYLTDTMGSVYQVVDADGNLVNSYDYNAWGEIRGSETTETVSNPFKWQTKPWDEEIGMYYSRARYYEAGSGRYLSTASPYYFAGNSPANSSDTYPTPVPQPRPTPTPSPTPTPGRGRLLVFNDGCPRCMKRFPVWQAERFGSWIECVNYYRSKGCTKGWKGEFWSVLVKLVAAKLHMVAGLGAEAEDHMVAGWMGIGRCGQTECYYPEDVHGRAKVY